MFNCPLAITTKKSDLKRYDLLIAPYCKARAWEKVTTRVERNVYRVWLGVGSGSGWWGQFIDTSFLGYYSSKERSTSIKLP